MSGDLFAIQRQFLKHDDICGFGYPACIEGEGNGDFTLGAFRCECHFSEDFLTVQLEGFTGGSIHEGAGQLILFASGQSLVRYDILNGNETVSVHFLFAVNVGLGADPRAGDCYLDRLGRVLDIGVDRQLDPLTGQALEGHDLGGIHQPGGVEGELYYSFAIWGIGRKDAFSMNFLAVYLESLTSGLVHEDAVDRILLARGQVLIGYHIVDGDGAVDGNFFFFTDGGLGADLRYMDSDRLAFVLNIRMNS